MNTLKNQLLADCENAYNNQAYVRVNFQLKAPVRLFSANIQGDNIIAFKASLSNYDDNLMSATLSVMDWEVLFDGKSYFTTNRRIH